MKEYQVSDLFFTKWEQLSPRVHCMVYSLQQQILQKEKGSREYGLFLINILRLLRKRKLLVDKLDVEQAVDIYNDLTFLNEPWYFFPSITGKWFTTPEPEMARNTFDHFIYADNEFSSFFATENLKHLRRLVATLYQKDFDKENVEGLEGKLNANDHRLQLVLFTFGHVRAKVMMRCKALLPKPAASGEDIDQTVNPTGAMWLKIKHRLADTPAFQGYDNAGGANMYSALDYLEDLAQQKDAKH